MIIDFALTLKGGAILAVLGLLVWLLGFSISTPFILSVAVCFIGGFFFGFGITSVVRGLANWITEKENAKY